VRGRGGGIATGPDFEGSVTPGSFDVGGGSDAPDGLTDGIGSPGRGAGRMRLGVGGLSDLFSSPSGSGLSRSTNYDDT
jgi:hypothetical protein